MWRGRWRPVVRGVRIGCSGTRGPLIRKGPTHIGVLPDANDDQHAAGGRAAMRCDAGGRADRDVAFCGEAAPDRRAGCRGGIRGWVPGRTRGDLVKPGRVWCRKRQELPRFVAIRLAVPGVLTVWPSCICAERTLTTLVLPWLGGATARGTAGQEDVRWLLIGSALRRVGMNRPQAQLVAAPRRSRGRRCRDASRRRKPCSPARPLPGNP